MIPQLAEGLKVRGEMAQGGPCLGLSSAAHSDWCDWFHELDKRPMPEIIAGAKTRASTIARKAALLYAWDFGDARTGAPWRVQADQLMWGIRFAELHLKSVVGLATFLAEHPDAALRRKVLKVVPQGGVKTLAQILRVTKLKKRTVTEVLDGLVTDHTLRMHPVTGGVGETLYERPVDATG